MTILKVLTGYFIGLFLVIALIGNWAKNQSLEGPLKAQTVQKDLIMNKNCN